MGQWDSDAHLSLSKDSTLSSTDLPFSKEPLDADMQSSSENSFGNEHNNDISEGEVNYLNARTARKSKKRTIDAMERKEVLMEDHNSLLVTDYMSKYMESAECGGENQNGKDNN